ncbi:TPA: hypothetical protein EYP26_04900 [Candidatus Bathyarchaeota archaeon]|nr:hypothetical protein [Candidatus Bathyarchaeota archaeon]
MLEKATKGTEEVGEFQRRTMDYVTKFAKLNTNQAKKLAKELVKEFKIEKGEAIQVVNCMPKSVEELRAILAIKGKIIETEKLEKILETVNRYLEKGMAEGSS